MAQDASGLVPVFFSLPEEDWRTKPLADAIRAALSHTPGFNLMSSAAPGTLVISVPEGVGDAGPKERTRYSFMVRFSRDGVKIGDSMQSCKASELSVCAGQIVADAQSAALMH